MTLKLAPTPLVAILRGVTPDEADSIAAVIVEAGFGAIEVPLNSPDPFASIEIIARLFGDQVLVGAGTVLEPRDVDKVAEVGARLVVAPNADRRRHRAGREARPRSRCRASPPRPKRSQALKAGASGLKLFPGEAHCPRGGPGVAVRSAEGDVALSGRRNHARAHRPLSARRRERLRHWLGAVQAWGER